MIPGYDANAPLLNTLRPKQNGRHVADDMFKYIFLNENVWIPIKMSLKFVAKGLVDSILALVQIITWRRRPGDKPLSESMMFSLPTHIFVTRPQRVNFFIVGLLLVFRSVGSDSYLKYVTADDRSMLRW